MMKFLLKKEAAANADNQSCLYPPRGKASAIGDNSDSCLPSNACRNSNDDKITVIGFYSLMNSATLGEKIRQPYSGRLWRVSMTALSRGAYRFDNINQMLQND
jgi:hypothetical protein